MKPTLRSALSGLPASANASATNCVGRNWATAAAAVAAPTLFRKARRPASCGNSARSIAASTTRTTAASPDGREASCAAWSACAPQEQPPSLRRASKGLSERAIENSGVEVLKFAATVAPSAPHHEIFARISIPPPGWRRSRRWAGDGLSAASNRAGSPEQHREAGTSDEPSRHRVERALAGCTGGGPGKRRAAAAGAFREGRDQGSVDAGDAGDARDRERSRPDRHGSRHPRRTTGRTRRLCGRPQSPR